MTSILLTGATAAGVVYIHSIVQEVPWEHSVGAFVLLITLVFLWTKFQNWRRHNYIRLNCSRKLTGHQYEVLKKYQTQTEVKKLLESPWYKAFLDQKLVVKQAVDEEPIEEIVFDDE